MASEIRALPCQLITEAHQCRARRSLPKPARHTARGQPWAGVWSDLAVLGMARQSPVGHCGFQQTHSRHSWRLQSASHGQAMLGVAGPVMANTPRILGCAEVCRTMRGLAGRGAAWRGRAGQGRHTAASNGRCSLRGRVRLGEARRGAAMQTHSGQRWPLQSAPVLPGVAVLVCARPGMALRCNNIRLNTGKLYE